MRAAWRDAVPGLPPVTRRCPKAGGRGGSGAVRVITFSFFFCNYFFFPELFSVLFLLRRCRARSCGCTVPSPPFPPGRLFIYLFMCREKAMAMLIMMLITIKARWWFISLLARRTQPLGVRGRAPGAPSLSIPLRRSPASGLARPGERGWWGLCLPPGRAKVRGAGDPCPLSRELSPSSPLS